MASPKTTTGLLNVDGIGSDAKGPSPRSSCSSPNLGKVSTINNEIRIGRTPSFKGSTSTVSSLSNARTNRSPVHSRQSSTTDDFAIDKLNGSPVEATNLRELSNEQIIDLMEKEQDGMVVRLTKEINALKHELVQLKTGLSSHPTAPIRRSSSFENRLSVVSTASSVESMDRERFRRKSSNEGTLLNLFHDNNYLIHENNKLRQENELLRHQLNESNKLFSK